MKKISLNVIPTNNIGLVYNAFGSTNYKYSVGANLCGVAIQRVGLSRYSNND